MTRVGPTHGDTRQKLWSSVAQVEAVGTTWREPATFRRCEQRRRLARDCCETADAGPPEARYRPEESPRIRMLWVAEDGRLRPFLDDAAGMDTYRA